MAQILQSFIQAPLFACLSRIKDNKSSKYWARLNGHLSTVKRKYIQSNITLEEEYDYMNVK